MPKQYHCANCGLQLAHTRRAFKGRIYDLIEPHKCDECLEPEAGDSTVFIPTEVKPPEPDYNQFEFVQKINDLSKRPTSNPEGGDRRPADQVKTSAPENLLENLRTLPNQSPERDL